MRRMLAMLVLFLGLCVGLMAQDLTRANALAPQADQKIHVYYNATQAYRVTVESAGGVVSVLDVPAGVLLSVEAGKEGNSPMPEAIELPGTFTGPVVIRARRTDEVGPESTRGDDIMEKAPLRMELTDATVVIERRD